VKLNLLLLSCLLAASCGGSKSKPAAEPVAPAPVDHDDGGEVEPVDEPVVEAPPPAQWQATATLVPVKGVKLSGTAVTFTQTEGENTRVTVALDGLKPGAYHLVVHAAATCGKNATKAGAIWAETAGATVGFDASKGTTTDVDSDDLALPLEGAATVIGHALVLHADKQGKPGKAVACGAIGAVERGAEAE